MVIEITAIGSYNIGQLQPTTPIPPIPTHTPTHLIELRVFVVSMSRQ